MTPRNAPADVARVVLEADEQCPCCLGTSPAGDTVVRLEEPGLVVYVCRACASRSTDTLVRRLAA